MLVIVFAGRNKEADAEIAHGLCFLLLQIKIHLSDGPGRGFSPRAEHNYDGGQS